MLTNNNEFRDAYYRGGAGTYTGTQTGKWVKENLEKIIENVVPFKVNNAEDNTLLPTESKVIKVGVDGYDTVMYDIDYANSNINEIAERQQIRSRKL